VEEKQDGEGQGSGGKEPFLENLIAQVPWVLFVFELRDGQMSVPYASPGIGTLFGLSSPEELRHTATLLFERMVPEDRERIRLSILRSAEDLTPWEEEFRIQKPGGQERWIQGKSSPRREPDGRVIWHGFCHDVTEQRRALDGLCEAERRLQEQEERLAAIIRSAMDGIITTDAQQRVILMNPAAERMFAYRAEDLLGKPLDPLIPPGSRGRHGELMTLFGQTHSTHRTMGTPSAIRGLRSSGEEFALEASISRSEVNGEGFYTAILRDVSERERARKAVVDLEEQVRQAQKMDSIGLLAGGVAHDFNNLLTVIISATEFLKEEPGLPPSAEELLQDVLDAGQRGASLTRQLLAFSRQEVVEPRIMDLATVVSDTEKMLRRLIGEDVVLATRLQSASCPVRIDPGQWSQVLLNLAVNARDAMPRGGRLEIETRVSPGAAGAGPGVLLTVSDNGCGMEPEVSARIFEPFFTTKGRGKGTGLGLAVVYGVVHQAGGQISVESRPGGGTRFQIWLPGAEPQASPGEQPPMSPEIRGHETLLLVEDDEAVRRMAMRILQSRGYRVLEAEDGRAALEVLQRDPEPVDLILADVVMPHLDGPELVAHARALRPDLLVLYTSGYMDDAVSRRGVLAEGNSFLQKPYTPAMLLRRVREELDARRPKRPGSSRKPPS
jgi:hypothetical protein